MTITTKASREARMVLSFFLSSTEELRGAHPRNIYPDNNFMEVNARAVIERRKVNMEETKRTLKPLKDLNLMDRFLFAEATWNNNNIT